MKILLALSALICAVAAAPTDEIINENIVTDEVLRAEVNSLPQEQVKMEVVEKVEMMNGISEEEKDDDVADSKVKFLYCPPGWFKYGSRCFLFVNTPMSWHNAEEHCNNMRASLASTHNPSEYSFLQQLTNTASQTTAWLGGFYLQTKWMWIDHQGFYYSNWYSQSTPASFPCMYLRSNAGWSNTNCGTILRFICASTPGSC